MGPKTKTVQPKSQASGLSQDVIKQFQGMLDQGAFGTGVGPLQRQAGTAASQFVNSGPTSVAGSKFNLDQLVQGLTDINKRNTETNVGNLRESFGALGSRYGTPAAVGEANIRAQSNDSLLSTINQAYLSADQASNNDRQTQLAGISLLNNIGNGNTAPFLSLASQGIFPTETLASPNPWLQLGSQFLNGLAGVGAAAAGKP